MPITQRIPWRSLPIETLNVFEANFNAPLGQYGFTQNTANQNQVVLNLKKEYIYLIDLLSFSSSIAEADYLLSLSPTATTPTARLKLQKASGTYLFPAPFPAVNYKDNMPFSLWVYSPQGNDQLLIDFFGVLDQVAATVGIPIIRAQVSFVIYQINNGDQVIKMLERTANQIGEFYRVGSI